MFAQHTAAMSLGKAAQHSNSTIDCPIAYASPLGYMPESNLQRDSRTRFSYFPQNSEFNN